eukprot:88905-Pyramimonas_sp.AAC.1
MKPVSGDDCDGEQPAKKRKHPVPAFRSEDSNDEPDENRYVEEDAPVMMEAARRLVSTVQASAGSQWQRSQTMKRFRPRCLPRALRKMGPP